VEIEMCLLPNRDKWQVIFQKIRVRDP